MDIRLPGENGLDLTKKVKENYPDMIIVIATSYDLPEYRQVSGRNCHLDFLKMLYTNSYIGDETSGI
jgi:two-component SAPR family response regulator